LLLALHRTTSVRMSAMITQMLIENVSFRSQNQKIVLLINKMPW
jgi:hypothetical protein